MPAHNITPAPPLDTLFTTLTSANRAPTWHHTCHLPGTVEHLPTEGLYDACNQVKTLVRTTSTQTSFYETVSDSLCRNDFVVQTVPSAVQVTGLRRSHWWRSWMWRSWAGIVKTWSAVVRPVGRTAKFPWTFSSLSTALVDVPPVSMPIAHSLKTWDICGFMLCDKTAHFRVAFYCPQHKVHLCNDHAV